MQKIAAEILQLAKNIFDIQIQENPFAIRPDNKYVYYNSEIKETPEYKERITYPARIKTNDYLEYLEYKFDAGKVRGKIKREPKSENVNDYQVNVAVEYEEDFWFDDIRISATSEGYKIMGRPYFSEKIGDLTETYKDEIESYLKIIRNKLQFMRFILYDIMPRDPLNEDFNYLNMFDPDRRNKESSHREAVKAITTNTAIYPPSSIHYSKDYESKLYKVLQLDQFNYETFLNQIANDLTKIVDGLTEIVNDSERNQRIREIKLILNNPELLKYYVNERLRNNIYKCLESIYGIKAIGRLTGTGTFFGLDGEKRTVREDDLRLLIYCDIEIVRKVIYKKVDIEFTHIKKILQTKDSVKKDTLLEKNGYVIDSRDRKRLLPKKPNDIFRLQELLGLNTFDYDSFCELQRAELEDRLNENKKLLDSINGNEAQRELQKGQIREYEKRISNIYAILNDEEKLNKWAAISLTNTVDTIIHEVMEIHSEAKAKEDGLSRGALATIHRLDGTKCQINANTKQFLMSFNIDSVIRRMVYFAAGLDYTEAKEIFATKTENQPIILRNNGLAISSQGDIVPIIRIVDPIEGLDQALKNIGNISAYANLKQTIK